MPIFALPTNFLNMSNFSFTGSTIASADLYNVFFMLVVAASCRGMFMLVCEQMITSLSIESVCVSHLEKCALFPLGKNKYAYVCIKNESTIRKDIFECLSVYHVLNCTDIDNSFYAG